MSNQKYAQVASMAGSGQLNWRADRIKAVLAKGAAFNANHKRFSETGGTQVAITDINNRVMGAAGEAIGTAASFSWVEKAQPYQVLVVQDVGDSDPMVLAFYDVDSGDGPVQTTNNGTLIVRPTTDPLIDPPTSGIWFQI